MYFIIIFQSNIKYDSFYLKK